jgi:orotidine-5'-phosphate decarboxylase
MIAADPRVIVALDFANPMHALALADRLDPAACALKVAKRCSWSPVRSRCGG